MRKKTPDRPLEWPGLSDQVLAMEQAGLVTRTFRRLDPERQTAVIEAILEEAAEQGPAHVNIKRVAQRAGLAVGSLYQYFGNRARMLDFAVQLCRRFMDGVLETALPYLQDLPLAEALSAYILAGCDWAAHQASLTRLFAQAAYRGDAELGEGLVRPVSATMRATVRALLDRSAARGEIRRDLDLDAIAGVVHALTIVLGDTRILPHLDAYFQLHPKGQDPERVLRSALEMVMRGLSEPAPKPARNSARARPAR